MATSAKPRTAKWREVKRKPLFSPVLGLSSEEKTSVDSALSEPGPWLESPFPEVPGSTEASFV
jgi:hypothetical protein